MMQNFVLSWTIGTGTNCQGGSQDKFTWDDIKYRLAQIQFQSGSVSLNILNASAYGPQSLQVFSDKGNHLLMLGEIKDGDHIVRTMYREDVEMNKIELLGDLWDARMLCTDFSVVEYVFNEFYISGDVSCDVLK